MCGGVWMDAHVTDMEFVDRLIDSYGQELADLRSQETKLNHITHSSSWSEGYLRFLLAKYFVVLTTTLSLYLISSTIFHGIVAKIIGFMLLIIVLIIIWRDIQLFARNRSNKKEIPIPYSPPNVNYIPSRPFSSMTSHRSQVSITKRQQIRKQYNQNDIDLQSKIAYLEEEIQSLRRELNTSVHANIAKPRIERILDRSMDCIHLKELALTHQKYINDLELKQASFGLHFPSHMALELEERTIRLQELMERIEKHCS
jgi:hypothetical protein